MSVRVSLYVVGEPPPEVASLHGRFAPWFEALSADLAVTLEPFDGNTGYLPDLNAVDAVVITGSPASLTAPEPWMEAGVELVRECYGRRIPLLGVCFGHQLIGAAFGASVVANPAGWELSTHPVSVRDEAVDDPLFAGLPSSFAVNSSHRDAVDAETVASGNGLRVLAHSEATPVQALAAGEHIRGVQFHPEFTAAITRSYLATRRQRYLDDGGHDETAVDALIERATDTPLAQTVYANFFRHLVPAHLRRR